MQLFFSRLSLLKAKKIFRYGHKVYQKKRGILSEQERHHFEERLTKLHEAIKAKDQKQASTLAKNLNDHLKARFPKTFWDQSKELIYALIFAIVVAFVIRQVWFELYEVPTGSMRPTIEELDRLLVSKTTFGINPFFSNNLLLFKPEYVKRGGIIVFTVEDMDVADADAVYFYLFPGKKRYIKRCMGLAGDTLYFYGGRIYGIDKDGKEITELYKEDALVQMGIEHIDHVPFISFDGKITFQSLSSRFPNVLLNQMNTPIGKFFLQNGELESLFFNGKEWTKDQPGALLKPHSTPQTYADLWGFKNYAMVRLLNSEEYSSFSKVKSSIEDQAPLYLEMYHTPNLSYPKPQVRRDENGIVRPMITPFVTYIPLNEKHIEALQKGLYTARFIVKNGKAYRYFEGGYIYQRQEFDPSFPNIPDGMYEFYYGKAYKVGWGGTLTELPKDHPLYSKDPALIQKLFNLGIAFNKIFEPTQQYQPYLPQRFAYFREGDFYVMGSLLMKKEDPTLKKFVQDELEKQQKSTFEAPYIAFKDYGPPLKNGQIDADFIKAFGLTIPEDGYLALGDNYAMSADSREFGFVPAMNLRGSPSLILWPPTKRVGTLPQANYPWFTLPNMLIWGLALLVLIGWILYIRRRNKMLHF